jgi:hypothetical protein
MAGRSVEKPSCFASYFNGLNHFAVFFPVDLLRTNLVYTVKKLQQLKARLKEPVVTVTNTML